MYALDVNTAGERWTATGIRSYLAGNSKRLYCIDVRGDLVVLDTATAAASIDRRRLAARCRCSTRKRIALCS